MKQGSSATSVRSFHSDNMADFAFFNDNAPLFADSKVSPDCKLSYLKFDRSGKFSILFQLLDDFNKDSNKLLLFA